VTEAVTEAVLSWTEVVPSVSEAVSSSVSEPVSVSEAVSSVSVSHLFNLLLLDI
jgi:hypothetical protein